MIRENELTLRDYFAAKAMTQILAKRNKTTDLGFTGLEVKEEGDFSDAECIAEQAYIMADAMIFERSKAQAGSSSS